MTSNGVQIQPLAKRVIFRSGAETAIVAPEMRRAQQFLTRITGCSVVEERERESSERLKKHKYCPNAQHLKAPKLNDAKSYMIAPWSRGNKKSTHVAHDTQCLSNVFRSSDRMVAETCPSRPQSTGCPVLQVLVWASIPTWCVCAHYKNDLRSVPV